MKDVGLEDELGKAYQIIGVKEIDANLKEFAFFLRIWILEKSRFIILQLLLLETKTA